MMCRLLLSRNSGLLSRLCSIASTSQSYCLCAAIATNNTRQLLSPHNDWRDRNLHTSAMHCKKQKKPPEDLSKRIIKQKSAKQKVKAWNRITVGELAKQMKVDQDFVFECIWRTPYADHFDSPRNQCPNAVLHAIMKVCQKQLIIVQKPSSQIVDDLLEIEDRRKKDVFPRPPAPPEECVSRPPVVTIMGHVDHGKTTLLDSLRKSQIVAGEFGGITQHIGAFLVKLPHTGALITFLDTPGHAAFHAMRQRGAFATDIVVLVVAAEDGVMDQTLESIRFARNAKVPMVIAINKCDKPTADIDRSKRQLMEHGLIGEEYGGDVLMVPISALRGSNLEALQEAIVMQAEIMELKGDPNGLMEGIVIESREQTGLGKLATVLVRRGQLSLGQYLVADQSWCKVRKISNEHSKSLKEIGLSCAAEIGTWKPNVPPAGATVLQVENEARVREVMAERDALAMEEKAKIESSIIDEKRSIDREIYEQKRKEHLQEGRFKRVFTKDYWMEQVEANKADDAPSLSIFINGDVDGSVDAIKSVLSSYNSAKCSFDVVEYTVGPPNQWQIEMAAEFKSIIYCFNIDVPQSVKAVAKDLGVQIREFNIIYRMVENLQSELTRRLPMLDAEHITGEGSVLVEYVLNTFETKRKVPVAGCKCTKGTINSKSQLRFVRDGEKLFEGKALSMKKEKTAVQSVTLGEEVGIIVPDLSVRFQKGDIVQCFEPYNKKDTIDWNPPGF